MTDRLILTPYFIDQAVPGLEPVAGPTWQIVRGSLAGSSQMQRAATVHAPLAAAVAAAAAQHLRPVSVAGDCCATLPLLAGLQRAGIQPTLLWFDAHGDFNTWDTSPSGFLGGMPLAMMTGLGDQSWLDALAMHPLPTRGVWLIDGRDLDPGEAELVAGAGLHHVQDAATLLDLNLPAGPLWVHFDVDVLDPAYVPAVSYPAPDGVAPELLGRIFRRLADTGRVAAVSVSAWDPVLDTDGGSQGVCMGLVSILLGQAGQ